MNADRQAVALRCRVDRPMHALAKRLIAARQQQHLHEAWIACATFNFVHRPLDALKRHDDASAQPRIAVQQFVARPVVHRLGESGRHVFGEEQLHAVQTIADRHGGAETVQALALDLLKRGGRLSRGRPPVRTGGQRRAGRVTDGI
jgi:hypothetical protein